MNQTSLIGQWTCPSGNNVKVYFSREGEKVGHLWLQWDEPPPLIPEDADYYLRVIRPEVRAKAQCASGSKDAIWFPLEEIIDDASFN